MNEPGRARNFGVARSVVALSLPLMGTMVGNLLMMVVDRICLARYSSDTLAASGPAVFTAMTIIAFFTATANLSRSCVAQALGRAGEEQARYEAFLGVVLGPAAVATARVLWTYSASFVFSMTGAAVLESFGMTRFILFTRLGVTWGISIPLIYLAVSRSGEDPARLPWVWVLGSVFEAVIGAVYFLRIRQATDRRTNLLHFQCSG